ncbi:MAG TPA: trypsin-like serine protease [Labilithrix sp.]|nr:trypsin-like serine protease [Labilithrix sp.]
MRRGLAKIVAGAIVAFAGSTIAACEASPGGRTDSDEIQAGTRERGYPTVGVVRLATSQSFCSGTLIAPDVVLTAAHCAEAGETIDAFFTGKGRAVPDEKVEPGTVGMDRHEVAGYALYPSFEYFLYCPNPAPDVALVRLKEPITEIEPARLGGPPSLGASCRAVGFGQHDDDAGQKQFLEKRSASVTISDVRETSFDVKAGSGLADHGDSGGPLYCDDVLVGTTSCLPDFPLDAVSYVSMTAVSAWISSMLANWDPAAAALHVDAGTAPSDGGTDHD